MNIDFINKLVNQRTQLTKIINEARTELAVKNTGMAWETCERLVQNGADNVCFNADYSCVIFPHSLVIVCTNDNSVHNKKQTIDNRDVLKFLSYCHKNEIRVIISDRNSREIDITFGSRYRDMKKDDLNAYLKNLGQYKQTAHSGRYV